MVNASAEIHSAICRLLLDAFLLSEFGPRWLVGKMWKYNFQIYFIFFHFVSIFLFKNWLSQHWSKMVNAGAEIHSAVCKLLLDAFLLSEFGPRWLVGKLWKYYFQIFLSFFIWYPFFCSKVDCPNTGQNGESWCRNSPMTSVFLIFLTNRDTCVDNEEGFSSWTYEGQKPLSLLSISSLFGQKLILKQTVWALLNLCLLSF